MERRTIIKDDLFRLKFIQGGKLSPDGKQVVYGISHVDPEKEEEYAALWLLDVKTGKARQLTSGTAKDTNPAWSPDGKHIAFISTRAEKPQVYVIPVDGGEARAITALPQGVGGGPAWSPDSRHIAFTAGPVFDTPPDPDKPFRVKRAVYRFDAIGYLDWAVQDIYVVGMQGGEARKLTSDANMNNSPQWSPDGKQILFTSMMEPDSTRAFHLKLKVVDVIDGQVRDLLGEWGSGGPASWLPDGKRVVFISQPDGQLIGSKDDVWVVDSQGGQPECRSAKVEWHIGAILSADMPVLMSLMMVNPLVTPDGKTAFVRVQRGGALHIYRVALDGKEDCKPVIEGDCALFLLDMQAETLLYASTSINETPDLYVSGLDGAKTQRLTNSNEAFWAEIDAPELENLRFKGEDGTDVEGWILKPAVGQAPYPTVLYIHGGPHAAYGNIFSFDFQMLAGAGYAVLFINHRASTGYGPRFATMIKGDWGNHDYKDLMAGVDFAIEKGLADPDRLGCCGTSGGGNLSCWVIGHTNRFKASVPCNPVTNWHSFYGTSDIGVWFSQEELGGDPWEIPDVYTRCSPITSAHKCTTPTLFVQAEHDWRCPAEQSEQFYAVLKAVNCPVEMVRMPKGSHVSSSNGAPIIRRVHNEAMLDWFGHYLLGKERQKDIV